MVRLVMPGFLEGSQGKGMNLGGCSGVSLQLESASYTLTQFTVSFWVGSVSPEEHRVPKQARAAQCVPVTILLVCGQVGISGWGHL